MPCPGGPSRPASRRWIPCLMPTVDQSACGLFCPTPWARRPSLLAAARVAQPAGHLVPHQALHQALHQAPLGRAAQRVKLAARPWPVARQAPSRQCGPNRQHRLGRMQAAVVLRQPRVSLWAARLRPAQRLARRHLPTGRAEKLVLDRLTGPAHQPVRPAAQHPLLRPAAGRPAEQALRARAALASQRPCDLACLPG
jgi:hypothetical protein